jgi:hypothetical protein
MDENLGRFSNRWINTTLAAALVMAIAVSGASGELKLDERDAGAEEWGYRPAAGSVSNVNPPSFSWRPVKGLTWEVQYAGDAEFKKIEYEAENLEFNVHCPDRLMKPGGYVLTAELSDGKFTALLPTDDNATLDADDLKTTGAIKLKLEHTAAQPPQILEVRQGDLH